MTPPSTYALDYISSVEAKAASTYQVYPEVKEYEEEQVNKKLRVVEGSKEKENPFSLKSLSVGLIIMAILGILFVGAVFMNAKASEIKYDINQLTKENLNLTKDIAILDANIASKNSIELVEENAVVNLGMVYPKANNKIHIDTSNEVSSDLVKIIKEKAYN